jgi:hypothetical protein
MRERRKEQRWPAYLGGRASFFRGQSTADVLIRNRSDSGAKLIVHDGRFIPDDFNLTLPERQAEYRVCTRWRRYNEIGVEFEAGGADDMPTPLSSARRIKQLKAKNAELKRRLAEQTE